jgi:exopolysaccharide production protein ExoQ
MSTSLASLLCVCGIVGLFYLDRNRSIRTSKALWIPVIYLWLIGSRPPSLLLGIAPPDGTELQLEGSPIDALVFGLLLAAAVAVLIRRGKRVRTLLAANRQILFYFCYCLISVSWAYYPGVGFKRWIKAVSDLAMVLVVVTDGQPVVALRRLFSRVGFVLFPISVLFIRYYPDLGRAYTPDGTAFNTGATTNKNSLGLIVLVISLGALWNVRSLLAHKDEPNRRSRLVAQGTLLAFGLALLKMADSATCIACFFLCGGLILATNLRVIRRRPIRVHVLCAAVILLGAVAFLFGGEAGVVHALGRKTNLSGRSEIWAAVIPAAPNAIIGSGFENFWIGPDAEKFWRKLPNWWHPETLNEAHNGYIETYLNLGWIGVLLIACLLISGYRSSVKAFQRYPELGSLILAYVATGAIYGITEAAFRMQTPSWIFLLLAIVAASAVTSGLISSEKPRRTTLRDNAAQKSRPVNRFEPDEHPVLSPVQDSIRF